MKVEALPEMVENNELNIMILSISPTALRVGLQWVNAPCLNGIWVHCNNQNASAF